ncbi:MAG: acyltransferase [Mesorhizobium sp.]|nr:MAG: acyltransferase [Mesorhizobium sp.]
MSMPTQSMMSPYMPKNSQRVGPVDALRGLAMTAVVAQHCGLLPFGWTGVWLFFVISGYVVTLTVISRESDQPALERLVGFFRRRALRIVPVYFAYICAGVVTVLVSGSSLDLIALGSLLGFINNLAMTLGRGELGSWPVGHLWTISVEMQFYVIYGFALFLMSRRTVVLLLLSMLILAPMLRLAVSIGLTRIGWGAETSAYAVYAGSFLHTDAFATGCLLAFLSKYGMLQIKAPFVAIVGICLLFLYVIFYTSINYYVVEARGIDILKNVLSGILWGQYREVFLYSALAAASGGLVSLAAVEHRSVHWLLRLKSLQHIGEISYGAYIYHAIAIVAAKLALSPIMDFSANPRPIHTWIALFLLAYLLTIVAAELSFRFFERRFLGIHNLRSLTRQISEMPT